MGMNQVNISSVTLTLLCEDSKQITAHKAILASSSPFFRAVLTQNVHPHPILYLQGISFSQLHAIWQFVYLGKPEICQDNIQEFLVTANDLQIEGLTNNIRVDAVEKKSGSCQRTCEDS